MPASVVAGSPADRVRTRTRLTTPPGREPDAAGVRTDTETYVPGLALPREPRVPGKRESLWITLGVVAVLVIGGLVSFRVSTRGQEFDPALDLPSQFGDAGEGEDNPVFEVPSDGLPGEEPADAPVDEPTTGDSESDSSSEIGL